MEFTTINDICDKYGLNFDDYHKDIYPKIIDIFNNKSLDDNDLSNMHLLNILGNYYEINKKYKKAEEHYLKSVELGCSNAMYDIGDFYEFKRKNIKKAKEFYLKAIDKNNTYAMFNLGHLYEKNDDHGNAIKYYEMGSNLNCLISINHLIKYCEKKIKKNDGKYNFNDENPYKFVVNVINFNMIIKYCKKYLEIEHDNIEIMLILGKIYFKNEMNEEAINTYNKLIALGHTKSIFTLAIYYEKMNDIEKMLEFLNKGIENNNGDCICKLGTYYYSNNNKEKAVEYYFKAIEHSSYDAYYYLGEYYFTQKQNTKAIEYWKKGVDTNNIMCLFYYGMYIKRNNIVGNIYYSYRDTNYMSYFNKIDISKCYDTKILCDLAEINMKNSDHDKMEQCLNKAINLKNYDGYAIYGYYHMKYTNDVNKMRINLKKGADLNNSLSITYSGLFLQNLKKYDEMEKHYLKAIELKNTKAMYYYSIYLYDIKKDKELFIYYCLESIKLSNADSLLLFIKYTTKLQQYHILNNIDEKNSMINAAFDTIRNDPDVNNYINKINFSKKYNIKEECAICFENDLNIPVGDCMHLVCKNCYIQLSKKKCNNCDKKNNYFECPFCRN